MKQITQAEFDALPVEAGIKHCPGMTDYCQIRVFGEKCSFGKKCSFGEWCSFGKVCSFGKGCSFGKVCSFGEWCSFGKVCFFGKGCSFGEECSFGKKCSFGKGCSFGERCSFGEKCSYMGLVFERLIQFDGLHRYPISIFLGKEGYKLHVGCENFDSLDDAVAESKRLGCYDGDVHKIVESMLGAATAKMKGGA